MISNYNDSKNASTEYVDIKKYIGVASVSVVAINPSNSQLRKFGWTIPEDAKEPTYVTVDRNGRKAARVRFLVQIQDLESKPVIALDFWVGNEFMLNSDGSKACIIDSFGRTAWGTKAEIQAHRIPQYKNGSANISSDYKLCHRGEADIVAFLMKYLNVTPLQVFDRKKNMWLENKNPGHCTIDDWKAICDGDVRELVQDIALRPENKVKVILGIRTTEDNKTYQTFMSSTFIGNGAPVDSRTGEYPTARKAIDRYLESLASADEDRKPAVCDYSALPVREWSITPTETKDNSETEDLPDFSSPAYTTPQDDDLPFDAGDAF